MQSIGPDSNDPLTHTSHWTWQTSVQVSVYNLYHTERPRTVLMHVSASFQQLPGPWTMVDQHPPLLARNLLARLRLPFFTHSKFETWRHGLTAFRSACYIAYVLLSNRGVLASFWLMTEQICLRWPFEADIIRQRGCHITLCFSPPVCRL